MISKPDFTADRRALIAGMLASLLDGTVTPVQAQSRFKSPVVDRLTLQVLGSTTPLSARSSQIRSCRD